jgi:hypothetical protein
MTSQLPPRGRLRGDLVYLGWRAAVAPPDPGPAPGRPEPPVLDEVGADWLAAQRREHDLLARPGRLTAGAGVAVAAVAAGLWLTAAIPAGLALTAVAAGAALIGVGARALIRGERALRAQVGAEQDRVRQIRAVQQAQYAAKAAQHAREARDWQQRDAARRRRPQWRPATLPAETGRVDVAGGTLAGWSALLTMLAAPRLAVGGEVTVVDLTEGGVAGDLLAVAGRLGLSPRVWVLPADLPRLDLGLQLHPPALADVLALTAAAADPAAAGADPARDAALLDGVLGVLGPAASMTQLIAALRALAQLGGPHQQLTGGILSAGQLSALSTLHGRGAESLVIDRAWSLEARLRVLAPLGTALVPQPRSPLRVAWTDRHGTALGNRVLGCYLTVALTEMLRQAPAGRPWQQTVCVLGADRLPGEATDRLCAAAETRRAGLVLCYQSMPPPVRERLGRGNAAVAFMRLGNAEEARAAAEQIGTEHRFVISQLTETVGSSLTDTVGDSYTSTVGIADSGTDSVSATLTAGQSRGRGRSRQGGFAPFADFTGSVSQDASASAAWSDSRSVTEGINAGTSWGWNTSRALGLNASGARTMQRSRELVIEQHELQHLPQTAVVVCQDGPAGREVVLADANPAIMALPTATLAAAAPRYRSR